MSRSWSLPPLVAANSAQGCAIPGPEPSTCEVQLISIGQPAASRNEELEFIHYHPQINHKPFLKSSSTVVSEGFYQGTQTLHSAEGALLLLAAALKGDACA